MGGTLKVIISPSITDIDPVTIYDQGGITLISQFCEYLINLKDDMSLEGRLAESWTPNETGDVWTFKLRQGIKFNDGSPFEAPDVVATMDRLVDPKSGSAAQAALLGILSVGRHQGGRHLHGRVQSGQAVRRLPVHGVHVLVQHRDAAAQLQG